MNCVNIYRYVPGIKNNMCSLISSTVSIRLANIALLFKKLALL